MTSQEHLAAIHAAASLALLGLIWTIQLAVYPLFRLLTPETFPHVHSDYMRRITWVVAPLMLLEIGTAAALLWLGWRQPWFLASLALLGIIWFSTAFIQVPSHNRLSNGFDAREADRLVRTNWIRTAAWSLRCAMILTAF
jgi:hypothetical protein